MYRIQAFYFYFFFLFFVLRSVRFSTRRTSTLETSDRLYWSYSFFFSSLPPRFQAQRISSASNSKPPTGPRGCSKVPIIAAWHFGYILHNPGVWRVYIISTCVIVQMKGRVFIFLFKHVFHSCTFGKRK